MNDQTIDQDRRTLNMSELAYVIGLSLPTLRKLLQENADLPVARRGDKGVDYQFDLDAVKDWMARHEQAKTDAEEARRQQLDLYRQEMYPGEAGEEGGPTLTPAERKALADAVRIEDYNRARRGELLERVAVEGMLRQALAGLQKRLRHIGPDFARETGADRETRIRIETMIMRAVNAVVDELQTLLAEESDGGESYDS